MPESPITPDEYNNLWRVISDAMRPRRFGWKRTLIPNHTYEYVIQREGINQAIKLVQQVDCNHIDATSKDNATKIRENALHALATLAIAMRNAENNHVE